MEDSVHGARLGTPKVVGVDQTHTRDTQVVGGQPPACQL